MVFRNMELHEYGFSIYLATTVRTLVYLRSATFFFCTEVRATETPRLGSERRAQSH